MKTICVDVLEKKLLFLLHRALVDVRNLSMAGRNQQVTELADVFECLPSVLTTGLLETDATSALDAFLSNLKSYAQKYDRQAHYLMIFDMDDAEFERLYGSW